MSERAWGRDGEREKEREGGIDGRWGSLPFPMLHCGCWAVEPRGVGGRAGVGHVRRFLLGGVLDAYQAQRSSLFPTKLIPCFCSFPWLVLRGQFVQRYCNKDVL